MAQVTPCLDDNRCACGGNITEVTVTLPVAANISLDQDGDAPSKLYEDITEITLEDTIRYLAIARRARDLRRVVTQKRK